MGFCWGNNPEDLVKIRLQVPTPAPIHPAPSEGTIAQIAQLVEQLAFNQLVLGSSPSLRTSLSARKFQAAPSTLIPF